MNSLCKHATFTSQIFFYSESRKNFAWGAFPLGAKDNFFSIGVGVMENFEGFLWDMTQIWLRNTGQYIVKRVFVISSKTSFCKYT